MALPSETAALTVDQEPYQLSGTVRGHATLLVRVEDTAARPVLRLQRFLPRVALLCFRDLAPDGSVLGPEQVAVTVTDPGSRQLDHRIDPPPGAAAREYRLEWVLDPQDHPSIGVEGVELLLFRVYLLADESDPAGLEREQGRVLIAWLNAESVLRARSADSRTPEPLRLALTALLDGEEQNPPRCEWCKRQFDLEHLEREDAVWEHSAGPESEEVRRLVVRHALAGPSPWSGILRGGHNWHHVDVNRELEAARERHRARLLAYAPSDAAP